MLRRSDRTLEQCSPCVRSEGDPTSGQAKKTKIGSTELWLHPVSWDRTRPVMTLGDLDLSRVDRTLGGSIRSLPLERPVSRKRLDRGLFSSFLIQLGRGAPYNHRHHRRHPCSCLSSTAHLPRARASSARAALHAVMLHSPTPPCPACATTPCLRHRARTAPAPLPHHRTRA